MKQALVLPSVGAVVLVALFLAGCAHRNPAAQLPAPQPPLPVWKPNPAMAAQLAPEVSLKEYALRLPQGYDPLEADHFMGLQPYGLDGYLWHHAGDTNTFSFLDVTVLRRRNLETPTDILDKMIKIEYGRYGSDFVRTKTETGSINGLPFARTHWQRVERHQSGDTVEVGFTYTTVDTEKGLFIEGTDSQPCSSQPCSYQWSGSSPIPALEAATLTFRQR